MVAFSLKKPCCQKIHSSGVRRMAVPRDAGGAAAAGVGRVARSDDGARQHEAEQAQPSRSRLAGTDDVEAGQHDGGAQHEAGEEPARRRR